MKQIILLTLIFCFGNIYAQKNAETIMLPGVIIDARSHAAVGQVAVMFADSVVAMTDAAGYFQAEIAAFLNNEPLLFVVKKDGYEDFKQQERWHPMNFRKGISMVVGMRRLDDVDVVSFADAAPGILSEKGITERLRPVLITIDFDKGLEQLKDGNDQILFSYRDEYYILSNTSWLKPRSLTDTVIINNNQKVEVQDIDKYIKRSQIKGMTPDKKTDRILKLTTY